MKSIDKLNVIYTRLEFLNKTILKNKKWKLAYSNKGINNYCLCIMLGNKELFTAQFATYGSVISALTLLQFMFSRAANEK